MSKENELTAAVMAAERSRAVPIRPAQPAQPEPKPQPKPEKPMTEKTELQPQEAIAQQRARSMRDFWAKMTPEQRHAEAMRRRGKSRASKGAKEALIENKDHIVGLFSRIKAEQTHGECIEIPQQFGCKVLRGTAGIELWQTDRMITLSLSESKLVAGAILNLIGKK